MEGPRFTITYGSDDAAIDDTAIPARALADAIQAAAVLVESAFESVDPDGQVILRVEGIDSGSVSVQFLVEYSPIAGRLLSSTADAVTLFTGSIGFIVWAGKRRAKELIRRDERDGVTYSDGDVEIRVSHPIDEFAHQVTTQILLQKMIGPLNEPEFQTLRILTRQV